MLSNLCNSVRIRNIALSGMVLALWGALICVLNAAELSYELDFDGKRGYIQVPEPASCIPDLQSFSIEFWAKTDADADGWNLPLEWPGGDRIYVGHNIGRGWNFMITTEGSRTDTHGNSYIADITGRWLFVQAVLDRKKETQVLNVYDKDNDRWHETSVSPSSGTTNPSGPLYIPSHPDAFPYHGRVKKMRFWHRARSREDALNDMDVNLRGDEEGLVGYWPMNEEGEKLVTDYTDYANHGKIKNALWVIDETDILSKNPEKVLPSLLTAARKNPAVHVRAQAIDIMWTLAPESVRVLSFVLDTVVDEEVDEKLRLQAMEKINNVGLDKALEIADDAAPQETAALLKNVLRHTMDEGGWLIKRYAAQTLGKMGLDTDLQLAEEAEGWPMWRYSPDRSAAPAHQLSEELHLQWRRELPQPMRAWPHQWDDRGKLEFDVSYTPVAAYGKVFVPSSVTDSVTAYDIEDGSEIWRFYTNGPVRLAPALWRGRVFFTSDDGHLYCVGAEIGDLIWKFRAGPSDHRLLGNERIVNFWAARGGPVVDNGTVYFAAGIWPIHGIFLYALDAEDGTVRWVNDRVSSDYVAVPHGGAYGYGGFSPQGYIAANQDTLVVSAGRGPNPVFVDRDTGKVIRSNHRGGRADGNSAVHAVDGGGEGMKLNSMLADRVKAIADQIEGEVYIETDRVSDNFTRRHRRDIENAVNVFYKLSASGRLVLSTEDGHIYCFGPEKREPTMHDLNAAPIERGDERWLEAVQTVLKERRRDGGYALVLGAGSGGLIRELLHQSDMHVVVVEEETKTVAALRDELAAAGKYGRRAAVIETTPTDFKVQPYLFSAVMSENAAGAGITPEAESIGAVLELLMPYSGAAWLGTQNEDLTMDLARAGKTADVDAVSISAAQNHVYAQRSGPLTDAGQWTHQYADPSNTNFSPDHRVKVPLGVLWYGGSSNHGVLPRHGHGPVPQVAGGRLFMPGVEDIRARCVYTGRELWKKEFPDIGHPFTVLNLESRFEQGSTVFLHSRNGLGANQLGSFFVSLPDSIYVRYKTAIYRLEPESGRVVDVFQLPVENELEGKPDWGHISVFENTVISTVEPQVFGQEKHYSDVFKTLYDLKSRDWNGTSSKKLVALDRHSGEILWTRRAEIGFRHNAIASGGGLIYVVDGLSDSAVEKLQRRGETPQDASLLAIDPHTGEKAWRVETNIFGTWVGYAESANALIHGGRPGGLRTPGDEPGDRIAAYCVEDGSKTWKHALPFNYWGPISISTDSIFLPPSGRSGRGRRLDLNSGEIQKRKDEITGQNSDWAYRRRYGCGSHNVSEHLITFRSGYAGYFDLKNDSGTGTLSGVRSGCTNNLIAADGVLNSPDYTRTCSCAYALQTSLGLIHMPDAPHIEFWTRYDGAFRDPERYGINFGAPGRRVDKEGIVWHEAEGTHRRHASVMQNGNAGDIDWIFASKREGNGEVTITDLLNTNYRIRLFFAELDNNIKPGDRTFDVLIDGEKVLEAFDIVEATGKPFYGLVKEFSIDVEDGSMTVQLTGSDGSVLEPVLSGIELVSTAVQQTVDE